MIHKKLETHAGASWTFDTMAQCAAFTGTPLDALKAAKRSGCRAFKLGNRVDYLEFLKWFWARGKFKSELPDGITSPQDWLATEKAKRERVRRLKDEATVLDYPTAEAAAADAEGFYFGELDRMEREMPPILVGLSDLQIAEAIHKFCFELRQRSREKFQQVLQSQK